ESRCEELSVIHARSPLRRRRARRSTAALALIAVASTVLARRAHAGDVATLSFARRVAPASAAASVTPGFSYAGLATADLARLRGASALRVALPVAGGVLDLALARRDVFRRGATVTTHGDDGVHPLAVDAACFTGTADGDPSSVAVLTVSSTGALMGA